MIYGSDMRDVCFGHHLLIESVDKSSKMKTVSCSKVTLRSSTFDRVLQYPLYSTELQIILYADTECIAQAGPESLLCSAQHSTAQHPPDSLSQ